MATYLVRINLPSIGQIGAPTNSEIEEAIKEALIVEKLITEDETITVRSERVDE